VLGITAFFLLSRAAGYWLGLRFSAANLGCQWHFLPNDLLKEDLTRSVLALHSQPPLFNLFLGVGMKLFSDPLPFFQLCFLAMSWGLLYFLFRCFTEAKFPNWLAYGATFLFGLNPSLFLFENFLFYTLWEAFFLTAALFFLLQKRMRWFAASVTCLMFTRASFHPTWYLVLVALHPGFRKHWRTLSVPLLACGLWMFKNWLVVGSFAMSTALGMGVLKNALLHVKASELRHWIENGEVSALAMVPPFAPVERYQPWIGNLPSRGVRALDDPGTHACPNSNHTAYVQVAKQMQAIFTTAIVKRPEAYLATVGDAAALFLTSSASYEVRGVKIESIAWLEKIYAGVLSPSILAIVFLIVGILGIAWTRDNPALFFSVGTILYLSVITLLLEIGENQRVRFGVSPLLLWSALYLGRVWYETYFSGITLNRHHFLRRRNPAREA